MFKLFTISLQKYNITLNAYKYMWRIKNYNITI